MEYNMSSNNNILLFAYGSMKKGFSNHKRLRNDILVGDAITVDKYNMFPASSFGYPYAVENNKKWQLHGELYILKDTTIDILDVFEGTPSHYYRKEVKVICKEVEYKAFIYFIALTKLKDMESDISINKWELKYQDVGSSLYEYLSSQP